MQIHACALACAQAGNVSQLTGVSDHRIWRVLDVYVNAAKSDEDLSDVTVLGMDETSVAKGHDYITLFVVGSYKFQVGKIIVVVSNKRRFFIARYF